MDETLNIDASSAEVTETETVPAPILAPALVADPDPALEAHEEVVTDLIVEPPPTGDLAGKWTLVALMLGVLLTSAVRALASDAVMIALKPFIPWMAFALALLTQTGFTVYFGQEPSLENLDAALLAGTGAVASHTGVRALARHLPALIEALFPKPPSTPTTPAA